MKEANDLYRAEGFNLEQALQKAGQRLHHQQVWFWRWREPYASRVPELQVEYDAAMADYQGYLEKRAALTREGKAALGLWSEFGFSEMRALFWERVGQGKDFGSRMSMWNMLFSIGDRDRGIASIIANIVMNFTIGLVGALVAFVWNLPSLIAGYGAGLLSGSFFFFLFAFAALSTVAAFVAGLFGTVIGGGILAVKAMVGNAQLQDERQAQYIRGGGEGPAGREHYD